MEYNRLLAEFLGTLLLVLSILASGGNALFVGLTLAVVIFFAANTSGGHVNPAVSVVMLLKGAMSTSEFVGYTISQCAGAVAAYYAYIALA
jgi:glycerol uptake facilitator-like aquaporin